MKLIVLMFVPWPLLCASESFAATPPHPADYTVTHVWSSLTTWVCQQFVSVPVCSPVLALNATIDGGKFELKGAIQHAPKESNINIDNGFLALGDYKARLLPNKPKDPAAPWFVIKSYELLLSDGRQVQFQVTGQSE